MNQAIASLQAVRQKLNSYLFRAQAATDEDEQRLRVLLENLRALESMINALTLEQARLAALDLRGQTAALDRLGAALEAEAKTIADVDKALGAAARAVGYAVSIASLLAGA